MSSNPPTKPARSRRSLAQTAFVLAILLTLITGFYVVERWRGNAAWKAYEADARARGVKLTLAEYVPPPVPDDRNFAAIPIFQDAFKEPQPPNPFSLPAKGGKAPPFGSISRNEPIDLAAWQKYFVGAGLVPSATDNAAADVLAALQTYAPQLEQLRIAGARPECHFPVRYEDGIAARLPHLGLFQDAGKLYALRMAAHLALGQSDAAYEDFRGGLRLYTAMVHEPTLIACLVRLAALGIVENAVWSGIVRQQWDAESLRKISLDLADVQLMDDYALGLGSERGFSNMLHGQLMEKSTSELAALLTMASGTNAPGNRVGAWFFSIYPTGWLRMSQTRNNRYIDETLARISQEPPRLYLDRTVPSAPTSDASQLERFRYLLFFVVAPAFNEVEQNYAYSQTLLEETQLGCALARYRLTHESYPPTLDALAPDYLPAIPHDVMNGEPLHYRAEPGGGYQLYSVGTNLKDDDGRMDPKLNARRQPDWVWSVR